jgi:uncharacterized protein (TIGR02246 family)
MKATLILVMWLFATMLGAQSAPDEMAVRKIIQDQTTAWNNGDAEAYSQHFAVDGTFTNLLGMFFKGRDAFRERHDQIFKTAYRGSTKHEDIVSIKFVRSDVAIVETLQTITGYQKLLPGTSADAKGRLRTRLLQVLVKDGGEWKIASYHNVDVKPGNVIREPQ